MAVALGYALAVPPWNNPDEPAHFTYIRHLASRGELPVLEAGAWDADELERLKASRFAGGPAIDRIAYEAHQPPLYYALAAPLYLATAGLPLAGQVLALRMLSVGLGVGLVYLTAALARVIAPGRSEVVFLAAAFVAFLPMHTSIAAAINSDALANLVGAALVFLAVLAARGPYYRWYVPVTGALIGAAVLTKATTYALAPLALAGLVWGPRPADRSAWRLRLGDAVIALGIALALCGWWFVRNGQVYGWSDLLATHRHDEVVVGQLRASEVGPEAIGPLIVRAYQSFWGVFGWMGVPLSDQTYAGFSWLILAAAGGASAAVWRRPRSAQLAPIALLGAATLAVALALAAYNLRFVQPQGRYLFPALPAVAVLLALGWTAPWVRGAPRWASWLAAAVVFLAAGLVAIEAAAALSGGIARRPLTAVLAAAALGGAALLQWRWRSAGPRASTIILVGALAWADTAILLGVVAPAFR